MGAKKQKTGKKNRKLGRNKDSCSRYLVEGRELQNKKRKMRRHLRRYRGDLQGLQRFVQIGGSEDAIFT